MNSALEWKCEFYLFPIKSYLVLASRWIEQLLQIDQSSNGGSFIELEIHNSYGSYTMLNIVDYFLKKCLKNELSSLVKYKKNGVRFINSNSKTTSRRKERKKKKNIRSDDLKNVPLFSSLSSWQIVDADTEHFAKWYAMSTWRIRLRST